jgi:hypothetical protein
MALGEFTKQLAQQALLNATTPDAAPKDAAAGQRENTGAVILAQVAAMQKALKEDEELALMFQHGPDHVRVLEIFMPSWQVAVLAGFDQNRVFTRAIAPAESLQFVIRVMKTQPGAKPVRIAIRAPKQ